MGSDDVFCVVWEGLPGSLGTGTTPPRLLNVAIKQIIYCGDKKIVLTEDGKLGELPKHGSLVYFDLEAQQGGADSGSGDGTVGLPDIGRIRSISGTAHNADYFLCVTETGTLWKVFYGFPSRLERYDEDITSNTEFLHAVFAPTHQMCLDNKNTVWSKGKAPYCGLIHSSDSLQKIPYLSGHEVSQLQAGADFTACVATAKQVLSPESPTEPTDMPDGCISADHPRNACDPLNSTHDSLASRDSCPLGVRLTSSPILKPAQRNTVSSKLHNSDLLNSSQEVLSDSKDDKTSSPLSLKNQDDKSPSNTDSKDSSAPPPILGVDECDRGRSSPISLKDIHLTATTNGAGKSSSEPPPSLASSASFNKDYTTAKLRRSASLTLSITSSKSYQQLGDSKQKPLKPAAGDGSDTIGEDLWRDEVWVWGEGSRGQLGQGDMLARPNPVPVQGIHNQFIVKVSAGQQHVLVLTGAGLVYGWGHNTGGQANPADKLAVVLSPSAILLPHGETARDIQAAGNLSLILSDSGNLYFCGHTANGQRKYRLQCIQRDTLGLPATKHPCSILCLSPSAGGGATDYLYLINLASDRLSIARRLAAAEKGLLEKVETVANLISQLHSGSPGGPNGGALKKLDLFSPLHKVLHWLLKCRNILAVSLHSYYLQNGCDHRWTGIIRKVDDWVESCCELGYSIGSCITTDSLMLDSDQAQHHHTIVSILLHHFGWKQQNIKGQQELEQLLLELYNLNGPYIQVLEDSLKSCYANTQLIKRSIASLKSLQQTMKRQKSEAETTRQFWEVNNSDARLQSVRKPDQRLVLDSKNAPVSLAGAITSHRFILFSDILIDIGYNKFSVHPLSTLWVEALPANQGSGVAGKHHINLTMPEGTKAIVCPGMDARNVWLKNLNEAVYRQLTGNKQFITALPQIPITRNVQYPYTKGELKGSDYSGSMTQGRMHGKGRLETPDGSVYAGGWRNDIKHGWGELTLPNGIVRAGNWMEGKLTGPGYLKFPDGSEYEGDLVEGEPHGHGTMKCGRYVGDGAAVYVGSWSKGSRHGYGVLEDTTSGERYMGTWNEGLRHGHGCVVNSDGIYYEGNFVADKLSGPGIMIFEDGAIYEGEFCGAGEFYGSGTLRTNNETFQGTFYGNYSEGMKFNGTVYRKKKSDDISPSSYSLEDHSSANLLTQRYTVPNSDKWKAIFDKIEALLCVNDIAFEDSSRPWDKLSVQFHQNKIAYMEGRGATVSASGRSDSARTEQQRDKSKWQGFDILETIPKVAKMSELSWQTYCDIRDYLVTANTCPIHPVHKVVALLVTCFNSSYGGLRAHPTLLPHAKDELENMCSRLYLLLCRLFPALPSLRSHDIGQIWLTVESKDAKKNEMDVPDHGHLDYFEEEKSLLVTADTLLFPLILPSIYPALFNLYIQKEEKSDREYWARITRWNKHTDAALLTFFDVDITTWDLTLDRRSRDSVFLEAVYTLQRLKTTFTPADKLDVIVAVFDAITRQNGEI